MDIVNNLDLLSIGVITSAIGVLGFVIFFNNRKSITGKTFLFFSLLTIFWSTFNYLNYQTQNTEIAFWFLRISGFFAVWHAFSFFQLFFVFSEEKKVFSKWYRFLLVPITAITSIITLTPLVFSQIEKVSLNGRILEVENGPGIALFGLVVTAFVITGIILLVRKLVKSSGLQKKQFKIITIGTIITFSLLIIFNFIFPAILNNSKYISLGALFIFPLVFSVSYAILRHHLFNIKVVAVSVLTFALSSVTFFEILFAQGLDLIIFRSSVFLLILSFGILLIKGVFNEVQQREQLEELTKELELANQKLKSLDELKTEFLSLASHQLKSPLTSIKGYTSMLLEGSFGKLEKKQTEAVDRVLQSSNHLVKVVNDLLNVSKIEQGGMQYEMSSFRFEKMVAEVVDELKINAQSHNLKLSLSIDEKLGYAVNGDREKLRQVVLNLIDNSIKYTPKGSIKVNIGKTANDTKILLSITDTGVGMREEIKNKLFQKFGRQDEKKMYVGGSGLGLYLAKEIIRAHRGQIWVESEGENKGSTFFVELDLVKNLTRWS